MATERIFKIIYAQMSQSYSWLCKFMSLFTVCIGHVTSHLIVLTRSTSKPYGVDVSKFTPRKSIDIAVLMLDIFITSLLGTGPILSTQGHHLTFMLQPIIKSSLHYNRS